MATLGEFARRMRRRGKQVDDNVNLTVRRVGLVATQTLVTNTPVDTGRARSNWQVGIDNSVAGAREAVAPGKGLGIGEGANAGDAIAAAEQVISTRKSPQSIHITNNLSYIRKLNEGHSAQAPAGFVQRAVQLAANTVRNARVLR